MPWYPISHTLPQYVDPNGDPYSGGVLKAYSNGTSSNIDLATDATGGTTASSMALNAQGYPEVSGNEVIPHVNESYKLSLYPTQTAADADAGAVWTIDELTAGPTYDEGYFDDTGAADAYVIAPSPPIVAYAAGQTFVFVADNANTTAATLNVNGLGAVAIKKNGASALVASDIVSGGVVVVVHDGSNFQLINTPAASGTPVIEATTRMLFQQTAAPSGWTKVTTAALNDVALRLTTGTVTNSTGNDKFSTVFGSSMTTDGHSLTIAELAPHTHTSPWAANLNVSASGGTDLNSGGTGPATGSTGGGNTHAHGLTMDLDYYEAIVATKD